MELDRADYYWDQCCSCVSYRAPQLRLERLLSSLERGDGLLPADRRLQSDEYKSLYSKRRVSTAPMTTPTSPQFLSGCVESLRHNRPHVDSFECLSDFDTWLLTQIQTLAGEWSHAWLPTCTKRHFRQLAKLSRHPGCVATKQEIGKVLRWKFGESIAQGPDDWLVNDEAFEEVNLQMDKANMPQSQEEAQVAWSGLMQLLQRRLDLFAT
jgi:hypothetical protein